MVSESFPFLDELFVVKCKQVFSDQSFVVKCKTVFSDQSFVVKCKTVFSAELFVVKCKTVDCQGMQSVCRQKLEWRKYNPGRQRIKTLNPTIFSFLQMSMRFVHGFGASVNYHHEQFKLL